MLCTTINKSCCFSAGFCAFHKIILIEKLYKQLQGHTWEIRKIRLAFDVYSPLSTLLTPITSSSTCCYCFCWVVMFVLFFVIPLRNHICCDKRQTSLSRRCCYSTPNPNPNLHYPNPNLNLHFVNPTLTYIALTQYFTSMTLTLAQSFITLKITLTCVMTTLNLTYTENHHVNH